ncbi:Hypothetical_protein [Hexamita inflata]|uniref:Hypothetical_protein n=1 Tax=Hexamita inflata TaxID=28002 RepID=A0AA86RF15_9EUKA|nr:Hypothetical protein HINF_LOCUS64145 [Hexamita inflata]
MESLQVKVGYSTSTTAPWYSSTKESLSWKQLLERPLETRMEPAGTKVAWVLVSSTTVPDSAALIFAHSTGSVQARRICWGLSQAKSCTYALGSQDPRLSIWRLTKTPWGMYSPGRSQVRTFEIQFYHKIHLQLLLRIYVNSAPKVIPKNEILSEH